MKIQQKKKGKKVAPTLSNWPNRFSRVVVLQRSHPHLATHIYCSVFSVRAAVRTVPDFFRSRMKFDIETSYTPGCT